MSITYAERENRIRERAQAIVKLARSMNLQDEMNAQILETMIEASAYQSSSELLDDIAKEWSLSAAVRFETIADSRCVCVFSAGDTDCPVHGARVGAMS